MTASSQVATLFAPPPEVADHPAVGTAHRLASDLLEPHAAESDDPARGVRREHIDTLTAAGLGSVTVPVGDGGLGASDAVDTEVVELLAGASGAAWFVLTQHELGQKLACDRLAGFAPATATAGPAVDPHREGLRSAATLAGIAINHVRRPGTPAVRAEPDDVGGYRFTGHADWCTGWGLLDLLLLAGLTPDQRIVFGLIEAGEREGLRAGDPLPLAVMGGTRTVALDLDGCRVAGEEVALVVDGEAWLQADRAKTANATPASLGLLRRVLVEMERLGRERDRPQATRLALALAENAVPLRQRAYALRAEPAGRHVAERTALRGRLAELTVRAACALVAARSGAAMLSTSPEQRWAREAAFHLVQAQTAAVRDAQLRAFGETA